MTDTNTPVAEIADRAVMDNDGDTSASAHQLVAELKAKHRAFYDQKADEVMLFWAQDQIRNARTRLRRRDPNAPKGRQTERRQGVSPESLQAVAAAWKEK